MAYHDLVSDGLMIWLFLFGIYFPEPFPIESRWARWNQLQWIVIIPLAVWAVADMVVDIGAVENYASFFFLQRIFGRFAGLINFLHVVVPVALCVCLAVKFRLAVSSDARRRVRLLFAGAVVSLAPVLSLNIAAHVLGVNAEQYFPHWLNIASWLMFFLFPVTLAYVVMVHRAMDVRVVVRQGLQYAVARGGIRALRLAIAVVLGAAIFSLIAHVGNTSLVKYVIIALGVAVWFGLRRLLESLRAWIDRHFFRDAYNAEQLLSELSEKVRSIIETQPLLATVAGRISESLHVPRVAVLTDGNGPYQPTYALGYDPIPSVLFAEDAATVRQLRDAKEPARVYFDDPNSWLYKTPEMTDDERARLAELQPELLLPLSVKDKLLGFISLGQKRSEEPYSPTDLRLLESVAAQTGLALEVARLTTAIGEEMAQRERLNRELEIAREVQQRLFPQTLPSIPDLDFCGACRPALGVGGDYYDFLALPQGKLGIALGDVSGKGIAAALMMASLQASLRAEASRGTDDLGALIQKVNHLLHDTTAENRYATFFYAQYDPAARRLNYVNAGHNPPMLLRKSDRRTDVIRFEIGGTVIGLFEHFAFEQGTVTLDAGDLFVAFTDGITETMNPADEEWGETNLIRTLQGCDGLTASEIIPNVMDAADGFAAGAKQHDDMTLVVLRLTADQHH
jgi:sigma-B regulation protein RsbU (phosphoserine phosphatase)